MAWLRNGCKENSVLEEQIKKLALHNLVASLSFLPSSYLLARTSRYQPQYAMSCPMPLLLLLFSHSVMSDSLQSHGLQHARLSCPSPSPGACSNSCPSSRWCHSTISSSVIPFSSCLQPFPASWSFLMSRLFASGGQSIGVSASASVLPMNIQDWFI